MSCCDKHDCNQGRNCPHRKPMSMLKAGAYGYLIAWFTWLVVFVLYIFGF
jgi:hypothetical protein